MNKDAMSNVDKKGPNWSAKSTINNKGKRRHHHGRLGIGHYSNTA